MSTFEKLMMARAELDVLKTQLPTYKGQYTDETERSINNSPRYKKFWQKFANVCEQEDSLTKQLYREQEGNE